MSPSRRRAIGAVRDFAPRSLPPAGAPGPRRARRLFPPTTLFPRPARTAARPIVARALPGRRDGDIAPYRHYTRMAVCAVVRAPFFPRCRAPRSCPVAVGRDAWPPGLPARAAAPSARCAALPRAPHRPWGLPTARRGSRLAPFLSFPENSPEP